MLYKQLMNIVFSSKFVGKPNMKQIKIVKCNVKFKAENTYDLMNNICLIIYFIGNIPRFNLINIKKSTLLPQVSLSDILLDKFLVEILPFILNRTIDKVIVGSYASNSNKITFNFKATDAIPIKVFKLWKLFEVEVGSFNLEVIFITNVFESNLNEALLRGNKFPVIIL